MVHTRDSTLCIVILVSETKETYFYAAELIDKISE